MYLFVFSYEGEPHLALCNESSIERMGLDESSPQFLEDLANISIDNYLKEWEIKKTNGNVLNVKIYKTNSNFDEKSKPIHTISELRNFIPVQNINW